MGDVMLLHFTLHFHDTVTLGGAIIAGLLGFGTLVFFSFGVRYRSLYEVEKQTSATYLDGRDAYQRAAERLGQEKDALQQQLAISEALPHYEDLMQMLADHFTKIEATMAMHEDRALARHEVIVTTFA